MLSVTMICMGSLKEEFWRKACQEYIKRLGTTCKINIIEMNEERLPSNPSEALIHSALDAEAEKIMSKMPQNAYLIALCVEGIQMDSESFAKKLSQVMLSGCSNIVLVIGSSFGLSEKIKTRANMKLSMSKMTFPHMLARVMLLEQLYRGMNILNGGKYHK